jgi:hypothetical protein
MPNDIAGKSRAGKKLQELVQRRLHWIDPGRHQADNWAVLVQIGSIEDTPSGKVRTLVMPEDSIVKKRLVVQSQYSYTYARVDRPDDRLSLNRRGRPARRQAFPDRVDHATDAGTGSDRRGDHRSLHPQPKR